jgi:hypothetical protein
MSQAVSRLPLTAEDRVRARVRSCGICGGQSGGGTGFLRFSPVSGIAPWLSVMIYHLGDEQEARFWPQFRDIVLPHQHKHCHMQIWDTFLRFKGHCTSGPDFPASSAWTYSTFTPRTSSLHPVSLSTRILVQGTELSWTQRKLYLTFYRLSHLTDIGGTWHTNFYCRL